MEPKWVSKRDPVQHPVRFLAGIWEERTGTQLADADREMGQLKSLRKYLGDFTQDVVEWMLNSVNWWRFCQQVRAEGKLHTTPSDPQIGFLLTHRNRALKIMRRELRDSSAPADIDFGRRLDRLRYEQWKALALVYAEGIPERLAKIGTAKTLTDIQRVFIEIVDENTGSPNST